MLTIDTARIFEPLLKPSRYKGAWGGRGSGKSHYMAGAVVEHSPANRLVLSSPSFQTAVPSEPMPLVGAGSRIGFRLTAAPYRAQMAPSGGWSKMLSPSGATSWG
jgi:hypothetical protein